jgi:hypothetical protein
METGGGQSGEKHEQQDEVESPVRSEFALLAHVWAWSLAVSSELQSSRAAPHAQHFMYCASDPGVND